MAVSWLQHLDLDDDVNSEIWSRSGAFDAAVRARRPDRSAAMLQGLEGLPWVPDLVGSRWREPGSLHIVGSAYSPFIQGTAGRSRAMSLDAYRHSRTAADFQRVFVPKVVDGDGSYYDPLARLIEGVVGDRALSLVTDLVRGCFVRAGDAQGGDNAVKADPDLFMEYARAGWPWTWRRLNEAEAPVVVALGAYAEHGLLKLLRAQGLAIRTRGRGDIGPPAAAWPITKKASEGPLSIWLSGNRWWEISGVVEGRLVMWRMLPVYHPARLNVWDAGYRATIAALRSMLSATSSVDSDSGTHTDPRESTPVIDSNLRAAAEIYHRIDPTLTGLLRDAGQAPAESRIDYRDRVAAFGVEAIDAIDAWVAEGGSPGFACIVLEVIGQKDAHAAAQALRRLRNARPDWETVIGPAIARVEAKPADEARSVYITGSRGLRPYR